MKTIHRFVPAQVTALGDNECEVTIATSNLALDDDVWSIDGGDLALFQAHPVILFNHQPETPVARASNVQKRGDRITATVTFPPAGVSAKADEIRGLVKSGVLTGMSAGIQPLESEPLDPKRPRGGNRVTKWRLLEASFVSVPADKESAVTARASKEHEMAEWKVGASRNLPIDDSDEWDGGEAQKSIFERAGGDDFDPAEARKGFLVYDASAPELRGSYKLPIAIEKGGDLVVPKGAIRAAASRLPQTDIPDDVKKRARAVLDHYKEKAGIGEEDEGADKKGKKGEKGKKGDGADRSFSRLAGRLNRMGAPVFKRGLWDVGCLAWQLEQLGSIQAQARIEAAIEGDGSTLPEVLADALAEVGNALIEMTKEEVAEFVESLKGNEGDDVEEGAPGESDITVSGRTYVNSAPTAAARQFRRGVVAASLRAGKAISKANAEKLQGALDDHEEAMEMHRSAMKAHRRAAAKIKDMLDGADTDGSEQDADDADGNSGAVQKSNGVAEDEGSRSADFRRRQAELLSFGAR